MVGKYEIDVYNQRVHFHLEVKRNITIIQGNSATGKTTLIGLIADYERLGQGSGVTLICDRPCAVLNASDWDGFIRSRHGHIIFLDENMPFIRSKEFAELVNSADNYFVLIYRDSLSQLAYSVEEIYGMQESRPSQKYLGTKRVYNATYQIYHLQEGRIRPNVVVTEDSNAGFDFWNHITPGACLSAGGKTKVHSAVTEQAKQGDSVLAVVDGAAFGADMERFMREIRYAIGQCALYAPESFEYLILRSGIVDVPQQMLDAPYEFADSREFPSWERFFTAKLIESTKNTIMAYTKSHLNGNYLTAGNLIKMKAVIPDMIELERDLRKD